MDVYLVGGAVRDQLLGLPIKDRDWVVVGATPEHMLQQGYRPVGKDFPVFLHPETGEEYALARTERKSGKGYKGFTVYAAPEVTLEEDLIRRDLTLNAIAQTSDGQIIDPFNGQRDIQHKILRHVSPAFVEDPLRVLRLTRLAAQLSEFDFSIAEETRTLLEEMVAQGELADLVPDRVWQEVEKALVTPAPQIFFTLLRELGALKTLFPELDQLYGIPNPPEHHPEVDTGIHVMLVMEQAARLSQDPAVRFAALLHDLGKALTAKEDLPRHPGHAEKSDPLVKQFCARYPIPKQYQALALLVAHYHIQCHRVCEGSPRAILNLLEGLDAFRRPERVKDFVLACKADSRGRTGFEERPYPQAARLLAALDVAQQVDVQTIIAAGHQGDVIKQKLHQQRLAALKRWLKESDD